MPGLAKFSSIFIVFITEKSAHADRDFPFGRYAIYALFIKHIGLFNLNVGFIEGRVVNILPEFSLYRLNVKNSNSIDISTIQTHMKKNSHNLRTKILPTLLVVKKISNHFHLKLRDS
ncbi:hypothetical protein [Candidatus Protochlamydia amoebophila]|uniref:hypothetical protein n=1 Tax=Candidatus Protochlamydia amoebophila TaxID=362787 RepID=UPI00138E45CE|nr:hypothetical protein [Candidatus Protochlamydia amoebophila]